MYTLLNTRPAHQASNLADLVERAGGECILMPQINIVATDVCLPAHDSLSSASFDKVIVVSANAANGAERILTKLSDKTHLPIYAIGLATFNALKAQKQPGLVSVNREIGQNKASFDSENLLSHADLTAVKGQRILVIKGVGGRDLIQIALAQRGAIVTEWDVYRRERLPLSRVAWQAFKQSKHPVVLFTSGQSFTFLRDNLQTEWSGLALTENLNWLRRQTAIVFSERIQTILLSKGWLGTIWVVSEQSDLGIIEQLKTL